MDKEYFRAHERWSTFIDPSALSSNVTPMARPRHADGKVSINP
jgi:hypothetical protein